MRDINELRVHSPFLHVDDRLPARLKQLVLGAFHFVCAVDEVGDQMVDSSVFECGN